MSCLESACRVKLLHCVNLVNFCLSLTRGWVLRTDAPVGMRPARPPRPSAPGTWVVLAEVLLTAKGCDPLGPGSQTGTRRGDPGRLVAEVEEWQLLAFSVEVGGQECHVHSCGRAQLGSPLGICGFGRTKLEHEGGLMCAVGSSVYRLVVWWSLSSPTRLSGPPESWGPGCGEGGSYQPSASRGRHPVPLRVFSWT